MTALRPVVIPAAGASRRFGDRDKLLAPFRGRPLLAHAIAAARQGIGEDSPVLVVVPDLGGALAVLAREQGAETVANPAPEMGMGASIACGIRALPATAVGLFILPGDMPLMPPGVFGALIAAQADAHAILRPTFCGEPGHPVWFGSAFLPELAQLTGDRGAGAVVRRHGARLVPYEHPGILADADTPEALSALE